MFSASPSVRWFSLTAAVLAIALCTSCNGDTRKPVHPTRGKVVNKNGAAPEGVLVIFTPVGETDAAKNWPHGFPRATTDKDGAFALTTYASDDGIPAGEYIVTMQWTPPVSGNEERDAPDKFGGRYADPKKSTWKVTIIEGNNDLPPFAVQ